MSSKLKYFLLILVILVAVVSIFMIAIMGEDRAMVAGERVVKINLRGSIQEVPVGFGSPTITPGYVAGQLQRAAENDAIKAVVLRLESPGGTVAASQEIVAMIRDFEKPIVVSMADMATSGGYYISAAADGIVAHPGTITGSIGVIFTMINPEGLYEKLGIELEVIKSGEHKDMFARSISDEERQLIQNLSDEAYEQFIEEIVRGRNLERETVRELATGEIFMGSQARELGLVDQLGGTEEALEMAAALAGLQEPVYYELPQPSLFQQLWGFSTRIPDLLYSTLISPDIYLLERLQEGLSPILKYKVPGY